MNIDINLLAQPQKQYQLWANSILEGNPLSIQHFFEYYQAVANNLFEMTSIFGVEEGLFIMFVFNFIDTVNFIVREPLAKETEKSEEIRKKLRNKIETIAKYMNNVIIPYTKMVSGGISIKVLQKIAQDPVLGKIDIEKPLKEEEEKKVSKYFRRAITSNTVAINEIQKFTIEVLKLIKEAYNLVQELEKILGLKPTTIEEFDAIMNKINEISKKQINRWKNVLNKFEIEKNIGKILVLAKHSLNIVSQETKDIGPVPFFTKDKKLILNSPAKDWVLQYQSPEGPLDNFGFLQPYIAPSLLTYWAKLDVYTMPKFISGETFRMDSFLLFVILNYLAGKNSYPSDITVYFDTLGFKTIPDPVQSLKNLKKYTAENGFHFEYGKTVDSILTMLKEPKVKNLEKLYTLIFNVGIVANISIQQAEVFYEQNKTDLDNILINPNVQDAIKTIISANNILEKVFSQELQKLMFEYNLSGVPLINKASRRNKGDILDVFSHILANMTPPPTENHENKICCKFEIKIPAGTKGIWYLQSGQFYIPPCSKFIMVNYDSKANLAKLRYLGSPFSTSVNHSKFKDAMIDFSEIQHKKYDVKQRMKEIQGDTPTDQLTEDQKNQMRTIIMELNMLNWELAEKYSEDIGNVMKICRSKIQAGGRRKKK